MKIRSLVEKIWHDRLNQQIEAAQINFDQLKADFQFKYNEPFCYQVLDVSMEDRCEILAIESSFARAQRDPALSRACLLRVEAEIPTEVRIKSFLYQFEKGLALFVDGHWIPASSYFLKASQLSPHEPGKAACLLNLIFCYENLGIGFGESLRELDAALSEVSPTDLLGIRSQVHALKLRILWREGKLLESDFLKFEYSEITQANYFLLFLKQIPYLTDPSTDSQIETFSKKPGHLFNKDFRLRTLSYHHAKDDHEIGRLSDFIERIYLWCWKWMADPLRFNFDLIVQTMSEFPWDELKRQESLSLEDQSLLILSLGWISKFDPSCRPVFELAAKRLKFATTNQNLVIEKRIQERALANLGFDDLNLSSKAVAKLENIFSKLKDSSQKDILHLPDVITVDWTTQTIRSANGKRTHSRILCAALKILSEFKKVPIQEFFLHCIGLEEYDSYLHSAQISNILFKLNNILKGKFVVRQKDGFVFSEGVPDGLQFFYGDPRSEILLQNKDWPGVLNNLRNRFGFVRSDKKLSSKRSLLAITSQFQKFTRADVQMSLNLSKTNAHRILRSWLTSQLIERSGHGKRCCYKLKSLKMELA